MKILGEIIELLSADSPSLENALFKAQVLAHRLGEKELKQWVDSELKGYASRDLVPPYRVVPITVLANLSNGTYRYTEQPLPLLGVDEKLRKKLEVSQLTQSIAVIEQWAKKESGLAVVIAPELFGALSKGLGGGYEVERAWGRHSMGAMLQVVVEVRSRLLDLALQISDRIPKEPDQSEIKNVSKEVAVSEIFRHAVFGDNATIVVGAGSISAISNVITKHNFESLTAMLRQQGVSESDLSDLKAAVDADGVSSEDQPQPVGPRIRQWMGSMVSKAGTSAWQVGIGAAGNILGAALAAYYGVAT